MFFIFGLNFFLIDFLTMSTSKRYTPFRLLNTSLQWLRFCAPPYLFFAIFWSCSIARSSFTIFFMYLSFFFCIFSFSFLLALRCPLLIFSIMLAHAIMPSFFALCFASLAAAMSIYCFLFSFCPAITILCRGLYSGSIPLTFPTIFVKFTLMPIMLWSESCSHSPVLMPTPVMLLSVMVFMSAYTWSIHDLLSPFLHVMHLCRN